MMDPSKSPNLAVYSLGMASGPAVDVQPLGWLPALPGQLLGDGVKYYQIGKRRSYGRLGMALLAVMLLAGLTANRYAASDDLRASVVVSRVTNLEAIGGLSEDELLTATCPCKENLIRWNSIVSFMPSILAMSYGASYGPEAFLTAQCNAMAITGKMDVVNETALNDTETIDMVNNDPCYKWPAQTCFNTLNGLRTTLPLSEEDGYVTSSSPMLSLPLWKGDAQMQQLWLDYIGTESEKYLWTSYTAMVAHNQGMEFFFKFQGSNSSLQACVPALKLFYDTLTGWLLANNADPCDSNPANLDARGQKRIRKEIKITLNEFLWNNTVVNTTKARETCAPLYCDVIRRKTALNWVTEVLSTVGGLWTVILGLVATAWALINCFSCMGAGYGSFKVWHP